MKNSIIIIALASIFSANTYAKGSPWYLGLIGGFVDGNNGISDSAVNVGFDLGYQNNKFLSTEVEYSTSLVDGKTRNGNDWNVDTLSVFAAVRTDTKDVKFKGKIGLSRLDYGSQSDTDISIGFGIGFRAFGGLTEIEYTDLGGDNNLKFFSLGVKYYF